MPSWRFSALLVAVSVALAAPPLCLARLAAAGARAVSAGTGGVTGWRVSGGLGLGRRAAGAGAGRVGAGRVGAVVAHGAGAQHLLVAGSGWQAGRAVVALGARVACRHHKDGRRRWGQRDGWRRRRGRRDGRHPRLTLPTQAAALLEPWVGCLGGGGGSARHSGCWSSAPMVLLQAPAREARAGVDAEDGGRRWVATSGGSCRHAFQSCALLRLEPG